MTRHDWDSTAPRRLWGRRTREPRPDLGAVEHEAELIRISSYIRNRIRGI